MEDKIYYILKVIAELDLYQPYWGLLSNRTTKSYFEATQNMFLNGKWLFAAVKTPKYDVTNAFLNRGMKPDAMFQNDLGLNTWFAWMISDFNNIK